MTSKGSTTTPRAREMRRVLDRWARSGLTQREFGKREGIAASTLGWWAHVFRHAANGAEARMTQRRRRRRVPTLSFAEVKLEAPSGAATPLEVVLRTGQVIRVPAEFKAATLRAIVAALEAPC